MPASTGRCSRQIRDASCRGRRRRRWLALNLDIAFSALRLRLRSRIVHVDSPRRMAIHTLASELVIRLLHICLHAQLAWARGLGNGTRVREPDKHIMYIYIYRLVSYTHPVSYYYSILTGNAKNTRDAFASKYRASRCAIAILAHNSHVLCCLSPAELEMEHEFVLRYHSCSVL